MSHRSCSVTRHHGPLSDKCHPPTAHQAPAQVKVYQRHARPLIGRPRRRGSNSHKIATARAALPSGQAGPRFGFGLCPLFEFLTIVHFSLTCPLVLVAALSMLRLICTGLTESRRIARTGLAIRRFGKMRASAIRRFGDSVIPKDQRVSI
jgi:hypothetical protein